MSYGPLSASKVASSAVKGFTRGAKTAAFQVGRGAKLLASTIGAVAKNATVGNDFNRQVASEASANRAAIARYKK